MSQVPIVIATDKTLCIHAIALIKSIEKNCRMDQIKVFVLTDNLPTATINKIKNASDFEIQVINITKNILSKYALPKKVTFLPKTAYFRFLIPEVLSDFKKVLYLDVDTLVLNDLTELLRMDLDGYHCLAVEDYGLKSRKRNKIKKVFLNNSDAPYFNSGVLMIDTAKWREDDIIGKTNRLLENEMKDPEYADQEALNVVLSGKWKKIERIWNSAPYVSDPNNLPNIMHFMGYKPIFSDYNEEFKELFYSYLQGTPFENVEYNLLQKALIKGPLKVKSILAKMLN